MSSKNVSIVTFVNPRATEETKKIDFGSPLDDVRYPLPDVLPCFTKDWLIQLVKSEWSRGSTRKACMAALEEVFSDEYALDLSSFVLRCVDIFGEKRKYTVSTGDSSEASVGLATFAATLLDKSGAVPKHLAKELQRWQHIMRYATGYGSEYIDAANKVEMHLTDKDYAGSSSSLNGVYYDLGEGSLSRDESVAKVLLPLFATYYEPAINSKVQIFG